MSQVLSPLPRTRPCDIVTTLFPQTKGAQEWDLIQIMTLGSVVGKNYPDGQNTEAG